MQRALTIKNILDKKYKTFEFDGFWRDVFGEPEVSGAWLICGPEKNGKTTFALKLADYLSSGEKVLYVSGEEGVKKTFQDSLRRVGLNIDTNKKIHAIPWEPIEDLRTRLSRRHAPRVVFVDNITVYNEDFRGNKLRLFITDFPNHLFIFLAHEEKKQLVPAPARMCRRLADIIVRVEGLACDVSGRCPGGRIMIDEARAALYHGHPVE